LNATHHPVIGINFIEDYDWFLDFSSRYLSRLREYSFSNFSGNRTPPSYQYVLGSNRESHLFSIGEKMDAVEQGVPFFVDGSHPKLFSDSSRSVIAPFTSVHALACSFNGVVYNNSECNDFIQFLYDVYGRRWAIMRNSKLRISLFALSLKEGILDSPYAGEQPVPP
jgi:hypothetical protein